MRGFLVGPISLKPTQQLAQVCFCFTHSHFDFSRFTTVSFRGHRDGAEAIGCGKRRRMRNDAMELFDCQMAEKC